MDEAGEKREHWKQTDTLKSSKDIFWEKEKQYKRLRERRKP